MAMMRRGKIPKEVQFIFDKYAHQNVRSLKKPDAINLLKNEFNLNDAEATCMFDTFDKDQNEIMSIWEFQQFYETVGNGAAEMLNKFHELDVDRSGKLDQQEAKEGLELMTTATGRKLDPREIEFFLKTASDEEGFIDIGKFVSLFKRLKVYDSPAPPKNAKCHVLGSD
ncbi:uncharacterized protein [Magallana gigas]|nr:uncharacterized protein LOC105332768 isoform X2 [Crassostrea gigas]XP_034309078.1 uncharacterized protein LOC105332768 isoform X2 [Crassostrea gigas]|eukprot:XP_011433767.1 PREDICTED: uncharacterized protein LOC105332768 isoform X2 [Crassostrea gigas]